MPESAQNDPLTRYLLFKASLVGWDHELGCESIQHLSRNPDRKRSQDMLYACIKEAQQVGDKLCALAALKAVVETYDSGLSPLANYPSILRCTIKLIHLIKSQEENSTPKKDEFMEDTCNIFEKGQSLSSASEFPLTQTAAEHAKSDARDEKGNKIYTVSELEWFRKNSYNIGVTRCHD